MRVRLQMLKVGALHAVTLGVGDGDVHSAVGVLPSGDLGVRQSIGFLLCLQMVKDEDRAANQGNAGDLPGGGGFRWLNLGAKIIVAKAEEKNGKEQERPVKEVGAASIFEKTPHREILALEPGKLMASNAVGRRGRRSHQIGKGRWKRRRIARLYPCGFGNWM